jgi:hypothetical protein
MLAMSMRKVVRRLFATVCVASFLWAVFWLFCRPVVILHYAPDAQGSDVYFFNEDNDTLKKEIKPGQVERIYTDYFQSRDFPMILSLPYSSRDGTYLTPPFSRVDIYIDANAKIDRVATRYGFFDRFQ